MLLNRERSEMHVAYEHEGEIEYMREGLEVRLLFCILLCSLKFPCIANVLLVYFFNQKQGSNQIPHISAGSQERILKAVVY